MINKKSWCFVLVGLVVSLFFISNLIAQSGNIPSNADAAGVVSGLGAMDEDTGLPKKFSDLKENADMFYRGEQDRSFLMKEWTKILSNKPFVGKAMFYTHKVFSYFNPMWQYSFGIEFSWSFAFFMHFFLWSFLVFVIYVPFRDILKNKLFGLIGGIIVASLTGSSGAITGAIKILDPLLSNIMAFIFAVILVLLVGKMYEMMFGKMKEVSLAEDKKMAKKKAETYEKTAGEALEEMGNSSNDTSADQGFFGDLFKTFTSGN